MEMNLQFKNKRCFNLGPDDEVYSLGNFYNGVVYIKRSEKGQTSGIFDGETGELILSKDQFDDIVEARDESPVTGKSRCYSSPFLAIIKDKKIGVCNREGRIIIKPEFKDIEGYYARFFIVRAMNNKLAIYKDTGEELLPAAYKMAKVNAHNIRGFIALYGDKECSFVYGSNVITKEQVNDLKIKEYRDRTFFRFVIISEGDTFTIYKKDEKIGTFKGRYRHLSFGTILVTNGSKMYVISADTGKIIVPEGDYEAINKREDYVYVKLRDGRTFAKHI